MITDILAFKPFQLPKCDKQAEHSEVSNLDVFERVTHHGDKHVDKNDDDGDVVQSEQKHSDSFHNRRRVIATWKTVRELVVLVLARLSTLSPQHCLPSTTFHFNTLSLQHCSLPTWLRELYSCPCSGT